MKTKKLLGMLSAGLLVSATLMSGAIAKLPAPSDEAKAKADEAKVKAAEGAKKESELLTKYQDSVAAKYAIKLKAEGKEFKPTPIPIPVVAAPAPAVSAAPVVAASTAVPPIKPSK